MESSNQCKDQSEHSASPFDPCRYAWSAHPQSPNLYLRRALDVENRWVHKAQVKRQQVVMYLFGELALHDPVEKSSFVQSARRAWMKLRWENPEVCLGPFLPDEHVPLGDEQVGDEDILRMCCPVPAGEEEASGWADATLIIDSAKHVTYDGVLSRDECLAELKTRVSDLGRQRAPPSVLRFLVKLNEDDLVKNVQYTFCVDHCWTDGVGVYSMAGKYFTLLAEELGDTHQKRLDWTRCADHLPLPWIGIMNREQKTGGAEFEHNVDVLRGVIYKLDESEWGFTIEKIDEPYELACSHILLSEDTTTAILRKCKENLSVSLTHLGHAAMILAAMKHSKQKKLPPVDNLISVVLINGRRYLNLISSKWEPYLPMCRAFGFIKFDGLDKIFLSEEGNEAETQNAIKLVCEQAHYSYQTINRHASALTESFSGTHFLGTAMNDRPLKQSKVIFVNDGLSEHYIKWVYHNESQTKEVFSVLGVNFTNNTDTPAVIIRTNTFRGQLRLSAEWSNIYHRRSDVENLLNEIHQLMLLVI